MISLSSIAWTASTIQAIDVVWAKRYNEARGIDTCAGRPGVYCLQAEFPGQDTPAERRRGVDVLARLITWTPQVRILPPPSTLSARYCPAPRGLTQLTMRRGAGVANGVTLRKIMSSESETRSSRFEESLNLSLAAWLIAPLRQHVEIMQRPRLLRRIAAHRIDSIEDCRDAHIFAGRTLRNE